MKFFRAFLLCGYSVCPEEDSIIFRAFLNDVDLVLLMMMCG